VSAGETIMRYYNQPHEETVKLNIRDVVTEGDKASEAVILTALSDQFPQFGIISEESGESNLADAEYVWHIDPIDGTTNFAASLPFFSVSIALADRYLRPVVGIVYNPYYRECYSAAQGLGATLNGSPIHVSVTNMLERAVLCSGFSIDRDGKSIHNLKAWEAMLFHARDLRRFGSAALDLAFVAAGRLDGYWESQIHSWDCMAGLLLVQEAGGMITDYSGVQSDTLYSGGEIVASNGHVHPAMLAVLRGVG
jgi:myo-inositol-1(or 4)-monophosphatase